MQRGMDFPVDITTNVFRVGDIKEVHWALYSVRRKEKSALQNPPSNEEEDLSHHLQSSEYILREDRRHVLFDKDKGGVWIFSLSQLLDEDVARTLSLDGFESESIVRVAILGTSADLKFEGISFGSIRSEEIVSAMSSNVSAPPSIKAARSAQPTAKTVEEVNAQAHGSNNSSSIQPSISEPSNQGGEASNASNDYSVSEVYSKFISAISYSLSHHLGKAREWIQVGPYACIDVRTLEDDLFENLELHPWIATTTTLTFDIKWLSSGTLLISFFQARLPRYTRMSKLLSRDEKSTGLALGSPLLLSPSGIICQYLGQESILKSEVQRKTNTQVKASVSSLLAHQGIRPMQEVKWIQVHMERESNVCGGPSVLLWPADLCFCEDPMTLVSSENDESFNLSAVDGSIDPLEEAESWFSGKSARIEASRARVQEEDQEVQALKDIEDTDDEDFLSPLDIPMDQGITPQDVSGIYPTPPDGLPSALLGSSNPNNLQSGDYDDEEKEHQPSDEARGDYDGQENEDLFGDIDIDMFASNGLTEADFSFFDEPGMIDEDLRETGQVMALDDMNEMADRPMDFEGQKMTVTPHGRDDSESDRKVAEDQEDDIGVRGTDKALMTTEDGPPNKEYEKGLESGVDKDDVDYAALEQLNLHHLATFQDEDADQRGSFEHVPFQRSTFNIDDKYNMQGRFAFDVDELPINKNGDRPTENHLSKIKQESPADESEAEDEGEDTLTPEDTDIHDATHLPHGSQIEPSRKRKREQLDEHEHLVTPSSSIPLAESPAGSPQDKVDKPMSDLSKLNILEETKDMVDLKARSREVSGPSFTGRDQIFIQVAQVVASQAVSGFLRSQTNVSGEASLVVQSIPDQSLQNTMTDLLSAFFPTNKRCSLKEYASLGEKNPANVSREQVALNQRSLKPTHTSGGPTGTAQLIFKLDSPYTRVRRNGISTEISASALSFWEELSLGPSYDTKDIDAFCLCPRNRFIEEGVMTFLNMIKGAYQSCNLGSHDLGTSLTDYSKRLITTPIDAMKPDKFLEDIAATCEGLGTKLEELGLQSGTTVIYIINPFKNQQYLPGLCDALSRLPNSYGAALEKRRPERQNNIVMQVVPLDLVWSPESIVVPSPADYRRLAFEIYNQCGSSETGQTRGSNFMRTPAIRLAKAVPKTIDFKLLSESSAPLMQSDNCVHVSYAWDATSEWLAAVWTDNLGVLSWRACYCLGKSEMYPWKPFYEVVKEILETSFEMLHPRNGPWQLFVCKDRPMFKLETDVWLRALADSSRPSISFTILTIDAQPHLTFAHLDLHKSYSDVAPGLLATPGATPQTNIPSPDISVLGSTPAGNVAQVGTPPPNAVLSDHDSEARLIDITDETWGIVMDGTLDDLTTLSERCMCLASGYLVKRAGPRDEDGLIPLGVNLVHGQKPYRGALKEVLGMYRNLGTLARVRGVVDPVKSVVPLHVAAARKAWKVVSETMRYEPE